MRVGVIGARGGDTLTENIFQALDGLEGVHPVSLGPLGLVPKFPRLNQASLQIGQIYSSLEARGQANIVKQASEADCDLILTADKRLLPETVASLKRVTRAVALWFPDAVSNVGRFSFAYAPYDAVFLTDPLFAERLRDPYGQPAYFLPEACNPDWHRPVGEPGADPWIAVAGGFHPHRIRLLLALHDDGIPLRLYGPPIPRWLKAKELESMHSGVYLRGLEKSRVFRTARGVLNNLHPGVMTGINARAFEATGAGGVLISEWRPVLGELFEVEKEVLPYRDYAGLVEQCRRALEEPLGSDVGDKASHRAHRDHTFAQRLTTILEVLT